MSTCLQFAGRFAVRLGLPTLLVAWSVSGCVTKAKANAQAHAAFLAGQEQAMRFMRAQQQTVTFQGPVKIPVVPWTTNLTLSKALITAGYVGTADPTDILIVRNNQQTRVDPNQLLRGEDVPLNPGDVVIVR